MLRIRNTLCRTLTYGIFRYMNRTEQAILLAANTVLGRDPSATLDRVAEAAGVSRMTLHRYFPSRLALVEGVFRAILRKANAVVDTAMAASDDPLIQLETMLKGDIGLGDFSFLQQLRDERIDPAILAAGETLDASLDALLELLKGSGAIDPGAPTAWLKHVYYAVLSAAWSASQDGSVAPNDLAELAWGAFASGVVRR